MNEHEAPTTTDGYDIYMLRACTRLPSVPAEYGPVPQQVVRRPPEVLHLGLPLADAQRYLKALMGAGGSGRLAPIRYRHPGISPQQGLARAQAEFEQRRTPGQDYDPIVFLHDEGVWWLYCAPRREPYVDNRIPGHMYLYIDKLDGHLGSLQEREQWDKLSGL